MQNLASLVIYLLRPLPAVAHLFDDGSICYQYCINPESCVNISGARKVSGSVVSGHVFRSLADILV